MSRHLGTIRNIAAGRRMLDLNLFDDGLLVTEASMGAVVGHMASQAIRSIMGGETAASTETEIDPAELAARDPSTKWIPWSAARKVRLSRNWLGVSKLEVTRQDGGNDRFEWKRLQNEPAMVDDLIDRAVPAAIRVR